MSQPPPLFTAARIAAALGRDKRGVKRALVAHAPAQAKVAMAGGLADAWSVASLPEVCRSALAKLATLKGCHDIAHLLAAGVTRWTPPLPLSEIDQRHIDKAVRVKNALARAVALYVGEQSDSAAALRIAHEDYQREFGPVSERQVRRVLDRAIERDAGEERFDDLSLYLDEKISPARSKAVSLPGMLDKYQLAVLDYIGRVKEPSRPTVEETDSIWFAACEAIHQQIEEGMPAKKARRAMVAFLDKSAVSLAKNTAALKVTLKRKLARYQECGGDFNTFEDQREKSGWHRAINLDEEKRLLIVGNAAINHSGRVAPALRELREAGKLGAEFEMNHLSNPSRKSYVPKSVRDQVRGDVDRLENMRHGPRAHRLGGAHVIRNYDSVAAGDWYQADDVTIPCYWYEETERGPVRTRGQWLVMIDVRSDYVLGFLLIPTRNYDSLAIRSLITVCAAKHGLPRRGFYFENGIWRSSKIIAGSQAVPSYQHFDTGIRRLGMDLRHARLPRGKVIERTIGLLQNRMENLPGYVGRHEILDARERVQRQFRDIDAGRRPINECLLSKEQMKEELGKIIASHNVEPQEGRLKGMSPSGAWEKLQGREPRQGFLKEYRYVLASDVRKLKVQRNGIKVPCGKRTFVFRDNATGPHEGEQVLVWFDPMLPDMVTCTDLEGRNPFCVERAKELPAFDATPEEMSEEMGRINAHQAYSQTLYWTSRNVLQSHHFISTVADAATVEMGETIEKARSRIVARQEETRERTRTNRSLIEKEGLPRELLPSADTMPPDVLKKLARLKTETPAEETP